MFNRCVVWVDLTLFLSFFNSFGCQLCHADLRGSDAQTAEARKRCGLARLVCLELLTQPSPVGERGARILPAPRQTARPLDVRDAASSAPLVHETVSLNGLPTLHASDS